MAKAKTPKTGGDKPAQTSTSRATSAGAKPKTTAKSATSKSASGSETSKAETTAAAKTPQDVTTSVAPEAKQDVVPQTDTTRPEAAKTPDATKPAAEPEPKATSKPAETAETKAKVETGAIDKDPAKPADPVKTETAKPVETKQTPPPASPKKDAPKKPSVFFPMLLGGVIAGGIGFAAGQMNLLGLETDTGADNAVQASLAEQSDRIAALEQASSAEPAPSDPSSATPDPRIDELAATIADLTARVEELSSRPAGNDAEPVQVDTSGFEAELAALKSSIETQRDEIEKLLENAMTVEEATAQAAQAATAQSAIARIVAAITTGQPFAEEVSELQSNGGVDIPPALTDAAETGVVTSANLQDRFPDASRAALAAARADAPAEAAGGFGSFLKSQLGARSVTPREGSDPDAILSRAEAAVRDGRLNDALTEIDALPDTAKTPLADWIADAQARQAAQDAVDTLTQRLTAN